MFEILLTYITINSYESAQAAKDNECVKALDAIAKDLDKHIEKLNDLLCK